jgi:hypothetical protein
MTEPTRFGVCMVNEQCSILLDYDAFSLDPF